jgi:hypothetical protein
MPRLTVESTPVKQRLVQLDDSVRALLNQDRGEGGGAGDRDARKLIMTAHQTTRRIIRALTSAQMMGTCTISRPC